MALRVIAGSAGGLHLQSPKRYVLRPTQDRIRQVIFSSLAERVPGARVLDLYAGTGSIGIEALSRGAASVIFVEREPEAIQCIRANLTHCHLQGEVRQQEVSAYLETRGQECFDLIFADPPYLKKRGPLEIEPWLGKVVPFLDHNGIVVWEHFAGGTPESLPDWEVIRHRTYGETGLTFLRYLCKKKKN